MSNYILDPQSILLRIILALFVGLLIGIDRDDSWQKQKSLTRSRFTFVRPGKYATGLGGVRTYAILSLLGVVLGTFYVVDPRMLPLMIIGFIGVVAYISIAYFLNYFDKNTLGLTTELGMLLMFSLAVALGAGLLEPRIVMGIAVVASLISNLKVELRKFIGSFTKKEILESIEFVALAAILLPWLPNVSYTVGNILGNFGISGGQFDSLVLVNPLTLGYVVVFISALNFAGYFLTKTIQSSSSILLTAFLGGIVSSTAVTEFLSEKSKTNTTAGGSKLLTAAVLLANMTSFIRIPLIALALNPTLFISIAPILLGLTIFTTIVAFFLRSQAKITGTPLKIFTSPLALKPAFMFGALFLLVTIFTNLGLLLFGDSGFIITAILASMTGLDTVTIITSQAIPETVSLQLGTSVLLGAVVFNLLFKLSIVTAFGEKSFKHQTVFWLSLVALFGGLLLGIQFLI